ncbi:MAG: hypothetical protein GX678_02440, partial [Actinomycetales bacterium]|nr:hypothetical protein [Actinomycetales bacterium]
MARRARPSGAFRRGDFRIQRRRCGRGDLRTRDGRVRAPVVVARGAHSRRPRWTKARRARQPLDAHASAQGRRPARTQARRPCGSRTARGGSIHRTHQPHGPRRGSRILGHRVFGQQARPTARPFVCADGPTRPNQSLRGRESPTLDKLGGADWTKRKSRARKAVRQIADELFFAEKTIKNRVTTLLSKLGVTRRTEAAVYAARLQERYGSLR